MTSLGACLLLNGRLFGVVLKAGCLHLREARGQSAARSFEVGRGCGAEN